MTVNGIDVSKWQASTPALTGLEFLFARSSIGTTTDAAYKMHIGNARHAGLLVGAYHFNWGATSVADQVSVFLAAAGDVDLYALDVEGANAFSQAQTKDFISRMHAAGKTCGLYHSDSGFFDAGQDWDWVAKWSATPPSRHWDIWQYQGSPLDKDRFNGDLTALRALAHISGDTTVTYPVPKVPSVGDIPTGKTIYTTDALDPNDASRIIVSPTRTGVPYLGDPKTGVRIVEYVDSTGAHTGKAYFIHAADLINIRAVPIGGITQAAVDAAVLAQKSADAAALASVQAALAAADATKAAAVEAERKRIAAAESARILGI